MGINLSEFSFFQNFFVLANNFSYSAFNCAKMQVVQVGLECMVEDFSCNDIPIKKRSWSLILSTRYNLFINYLLLNSVILFFLPCFSTYVKSGLIFCLLYNHLLSFFEGKDKKWLCNLSKTVKKYEI